MFCTGGTPSFLNLPGDAIPGPPYWTAPNVSRLWLYNLHYFDDLNAEGADGRVALHRELIGRWIDENPAPVGTGWEPYPTSLRIVNWIKWALAGNDLLADWQRSLALQTAWLEKHIEWHLLGNHLFANAKALVSAGIYFEGKIADRWLKKGLKILAREVPEQILADGGQFELSPMYHSIATEDVLDLINIARTFSGHVPETQIEEWSNVVGSMLGWADVMQHPDKKIVLFNDSAFGIAPELSEIFSYADRLGIDWQRLEGSVQFLENSGYVRAEVCEAVLFTDVAKIGPDYLPGHAHADTLTFELSLFDDRWIVDTGCSTYEVTEERFRQRSTAAHNTVTVNDEDSSEVWSGFRVAGRARPQNVQVKEEDGSVCISASHDGYRRLKGKVMHQREFSLSNGELVINDEVTGKYEKAVANFLLHPEVKAQLAGQTVELQRNGKKAAFKFDDGEVSIVESTWHPEFGMSIPTHSIAVTIAASTLTSTLLWGAGN